MSTKKITTFAIILAVAIVASFFSFPILPAAPFLKIDFSDSFILLIGLLFGFKELLIAIFLKGIFLYIKDPEFIGVFANLMSAFLFTGTFLFIMQKTKKWLLALSVSTVISTIALSIFNYFVLLPMYTTVYKMNLGSLETVIITAIIPFNLIKGTLQSFVSVMLMKQKQIFKQ
ncbi:ECF transporter S component [Carnobacteriaceae bacterium zg-ZUI252]|nr:ECF transporter S component [Carnobacteriaceae bacterium zg-ZUI252]MBS4770751.1 ECF transporter S component [Carnobacteriaceae bacterium zg-ZUI240]